MAKAQLCVSASKDLWQLVHRSRSREVIQSLIAAGLCQDTSHFFRSHLVARHLRGKYCLCMVCVDRVAAELALALSAACFAFAPPFFFPCEQETAVSASPTILCEGLARRFAWCSTIRCGWLRAASSATVWRLSRPPKQHLGTSLTNMSWTDFCQQQTGMDGEASTTSAAAT